jgi:RNA-splicing ligase RtcB
MNFNTKYGEVVIYAKTVEQEAISQIMEMANSPLGENAHIRIMPDCHAGAGCVIGTTMKITDKVCPNLVGVDIGCGVDLVKTDIDFESRLPELDAAIRKYVPFGVKTHERIKPWDFEKLFCWQYLDRETRLKATTSLGTLGGGNHFIEAYEGGWLAVHSGSRNIGYKVAEYYQQLAKKRIKEYYSSAKKERSREGFREILPLGVHMNDDLCFLMGADMENYLHDVTVMQRFAHDNREAMLKALTSALGGKITERISSVHNYIDTENMYLRKGAISAEEGKLLVIPLNMKDGLLLCRGKGNPEWNHSAPHGAGRLYSRSRAKELFTVEEYKTEMEGIFSTCINASTLDEAPFVYKDYKEIMECIEPTVEILERLIPIFNFKANE